MTLTSVVRFRTGNGEYAVAVEHAREIRSAAGLITIPTPGPAVVGLLRREDDVLTVLSVLGTGRDHVLVLDNGVAFGLLVEEVSGVVDIDDADIDPPPNGQQDELVSGIIRASDGMVLLVDVSILARALTP